MTNLQTKKTAGGDGKKEKFGGSEGEFFGGLSDRISFKAEHMYTRISE